MAAGFQDLPPLHDVDLVRQGRGGQPVGDQQQGAALGQVAQPGEPAGLGPGVEGPGRLVQDQDGGTPYQGPGQGQALPLTAAEVRPALEPQA